MPYSDPIKQKQYFADRYRKKKPIISEQKRLCRYKSLYGITIADYDAMLFAQGGRCAICGSERPMGKGRFHVDHDHKNGKVRGLLCHLCNTALGRIERFDSWLDYLGLVKQ